MKDARGGDARRAPERSWSGRNGPTARAWRKGIRDRPAARAGRSPPLRHLLHVHRVEFPPGLGRAIASLAILRSEGIAKSQS